MWVATREACGWRRGKHVGGIPKLGGPLDHVVREDADPEDGHHKGGEELGLVLLLGAVGDGRLEEGRQRHRDRLVDRAGLVLVVLVPVLSLRGAHARGSTG